MTFIDSIKTCFRKYINFSGRASRSEFWWFFLFCTIASGIINSIAFKLGLNEIWAVCINLVFFVPSLAVSVRRLHDIDKTGWLLLLAFVPFFGQIILLVLFCQKGTEGSNQFGESSV